MESLKDLTRAQLESQILTLRSLVKDTQGSLEREIATCENKLAELKAALQIQRLFSKFIASREAEGEAAVAVEAAMAEVPAEAAPEEATPFVKEP